jgi:hypothetical protein
MDKVTIKPPKINRAFNERVFVVKLFDLMV